MKIYLGGAPFVKVAVFCIPEDSANFLINDQKRQLTPSQIIK